MRDNKVQFTEQEYKSFVIRIDVNEKHISYEQFTNCLLPKECFHYPMFRCGENFDLGYIKYELE